MMRHDNPVCKDRSPGAPASAGLEYPEIWEKKVVITALDLGRTVLAVISVSQSARSQDRHSPAHLGLRYTHLGEPRWGQACDLVEIDSEARMGVP
jgi:hypothetical protein